MRIAGSGSFSPIAECRIPVIPVKNIRAEICDVHVRQPVIIHVAYASTLAVHSRSDTSGCGDIREYSFAVISIQRIPVRFGLAPFWKAVGVDEIQILIQVAIVVDHKHAVACRFQDVIFIRASTVRDYREAGFFCAIQELHVFAGCSEKHYEHRKQDVKEERRTVQRQNAL